jgi:hypothetical protein
MVTTQYNVKVKVKVKLSLCLTKYRAMHLTKHRVMTYGGEGV